MISEFLLLSEFELITDKSINIVYISIYVVLDRM